MKILLIGGAGYVGSMLARKLLENEHDVSIYDLMIYGKPNLNHDNLDFIQGDIRDFEKLFKTVMGHDCIIHLACISNDPSFELNPDLGKSINYDCLEPLIKFCKNDAGIKKFIFASSSSVYGIKKEENVTENLNLEPLTDYSKYKAMCEDVLLKYTSNDFITTILRPATVCGYSIRQRLDVIVNILSNHAFHNKKMIINGGSQKRPNINIKDMVLAYTQILNSSHELINGEIFNVGFENHTLDQLAQIVNEVMGGNIKIEHKDTDDNRSYHISSNKISKVLNFYPSYNIKESVMSLIEKFNDKTLFNTFDNNNYFNIKKMMEINLK